MRVVSTQGVPAGERFCFWRDLSLGGQVPLKAWCDRRVEAEFWAETRILDLGPVQMKVQTSTPYGIHGTPKLVRQADPDLCKVTLGMHGTTAITQDDRQVMVTRGDLVFYDTSRPYSGLLDPGRPSNQLLTLRFARSLLPLPPQELRRLAAVRIPGSRGIGAPTSHFLLQLAQHMDEYSPADAARLSTLVLDVLAAALAHALDVDGSVPPQTRHQALLARIHAFIQDNLGDPGLTPGSIAAAHHISLRHLHKLFHDQGRTVAAWIRQCRLDRCRRDLADPLLACRPVSAIGARWGFRDATQFGRAFRAAYDTAPTEFRQQASHQRHPH